VETNETPEQAALRETYEETGYQVELIKLVAEYHRPQLNEMLSLYRCRVVGGQPIARGPETVQVAWFNLDALPRPLAPSLREMVEDARHVGCSPISKEVCFPVWQIILRKLLIRLRNLCNRVLGKP
jgi:ADP-ribose pyrophosphatase YjhB (NUDIX family)